MKYLGYFYHKISSLKLMKIAQSGHSDGDCRAAAIEGRRRRVEDLARFEQNVNFQELLFCYNKF